MIKNKSSIALIVLSVLSSAANANANANAQQYSIKDIQCEALVKYSGSEGGNPSSQAINLYTNPYNSAVEDGSTKVLGTRFEVSLTQNSPTSVGGILNMIPPSTNGGKITVQFNMPMSEHVGPTLVLLTSHQKGAQGNDEVVFQNLKCFLPGQEN